MSTAVKEAALVAEVQGSGSKPYTVTIYMDGTNYCTCPGWRFKKGLAPEERSCKHTKQFS